MGMDARASSCMRPRKACTTAGGQVRGTGRDSPVGGTEVAWLWQRQRAAGDMSASGRAADVRGGTGDAPASGWEGDGLSRTNNGLWT